MGISLYLYERQFTLWSLSVLCLCAVSLIPSPSLGMRLAPCVRMVTCPFHQL